MMMLEDEVKEFVNKVIRREHGKAIEVDDLLTDSEIDSFAYAILWLELEDQYKCFNILKVNEIDYKAYRLRDVIETIRAYNAG